MSLRDLLAKHGYEVLLADNGEAALKLLRSESIDVLMLDLVMPGGNGQGLLREMKADEKLTSIPVILLTAVSNSKEIAECQEIGVDDFISKPWNEAELLARLRTTAQLKHAAGTAVRLACPEHASRQPPDLPLGVSERRDRMRPRVLVVDDSMTICMRLTSELQAGGMDAVATDRADDALSRVQRERFDVAITDVVMPCMDGEELIQCLGELAPQLPCIVLTGSAEMAAVRRLAQARNVAGILVKPWDRVKLMAVLKSALERRERTDNTARSG